MGTYKRSQAFICRIIWKDWIESIFKSLFTFLFWTLMWSQALQTLSLTLSSMRLRKYQVNYSSTFQTIFSGWLSNSAYSQWACEYSWHNQWEMARKTAHQYQWAWYCRRKLSSHIEFYPAETSRSQDRFSRNHIIVYYTLVLASLPSRPSATCYPKNLQCREGQIKERPLLLFIFTFYNVPNLKHRAGLNPEFF